MGLMLREIAVSDLDQTYLCCDLMVRTTSCQVKNFVYCCSGHKIQRFIYVVLGGINICRVCFKTILPCHILGKK